MRKEKLSRLVPAERAVHRVRSTKFIDTCLDELAALSPMAYQFERKSTARKLGLRVGFIDSHVAKRRQSLELERAHDQFRSLDPASSPIDGDELLTRLCEAIADHVAMPIESMRAVALWILFTHTHSAFRHSPILVISSPVKRCGKTTLMEFLGTIVPKPLMSSHTTAAGIFRIVDAYEPTLLIDEGDTFLAGNNQLRGILNSGHSKAGARILRDKKSFSTWSAKAVALIGRVASTLEDRAILIELNRKGPGRNVSPIRNDPGAYDELHRWCRRWAVDHVAGLENADVTFPDRLHDRARDNWRPLFAIAERCGGNWPIRARNAARYLSVSDDDGDASVTLLQDLRRLFARNDGQNLSSAAIARELASMEHRPWPDFNQGQAITPRAIANLLVPFKIKPRQVLLSDGRRVQGYLRRQFDFAFAHYLAPASPVSPEK